MMLCVMMWCVATDALCQQQIYHRLFWNLFLWNLEACGGFSYSKKQETDFSSIKLVGVKKGGGGRVENI